MSNIEDIEKMKRKMWRYKLFAIIAIGSSLIPLGGLVWMLFRVIA